MTSASYLRIAEFRESFPDIPILALTASHSQVASDIMEKLRFRKEHKLIQTSFERKNLAYIVRKAEDKLGQVLRIAQGVGGCGLVYVRERKKAEDVAEFLLFNGVKADAYHAGMNAAARTVKQDEWKNGKTQVMVATNAFGMGIDKPDVRFVCHYDVPDSPEAYFQEAGRAGRDGQKAYAVLLYAPSDAKRMQQIYSISFPEPAFIKETYQNLYSFLELGYGEGAGRQFDFNLSEFAKRQKKYPLTLCMPFNAGTEGISPYRRAGQSLSDHVHCKQDELYRIQIAKPQLDTFIKVLLRTYTGLFNGFVSIDEEYLANISRNAKTVVMEFLMQLSRLGVLSYIPRKKAPQVFLHAQRLEPGNVYLNPVHFLQRKEAYAKRMEAMLNYAQSECPCRSKQLLAYFGEGKAEDCGICDVCIGRQQGENAKKPSIDCVSIREQSEKGRCTYTR
jgi:ATP-dependent DNA helicase RecQ